jgi:hypothetical protein
VNVPRLYPVRFGAPTGPVRTGDLVDDLARTSPGRARQAWFRRRHGFRPGGRSATSTVPERSVVTTTRTPKPSSGPALHRYRGPPDMTLVTAGRGMTGQHVRLL